MQTSLNCQKLVSILGSQSKGTEIMRKTKKKDLQCRHQEVHTLRMQELSLAKDWGSLIKVTFLERGLVS